MRLLNKKALMFTALFASTCFANIAQAKCAPCEQRRAAAQQINQGTKPNMTNLTPPTEAYKFKQHPVEATIVTSKGEIVCTLRPDKAPITVANFKQLADAKFYKDLTFHRYEQDFVIQGGDPLGKGTGGPGYTIKAEFTDLQHTKGALAMARSGHPDSAGSQFYITLDDAHFLNNNYAVFGYVKSGMDVLQNLRAGDKIRSVTVTD